MAISYFKITRIEIRYHWRLFVIHARKHVKLARLSLAGLLLKLAFWISPLLEYELSRGFTARPRAINSRLNKHDDNYDAITPISVEYDQAVPEDYGDVMSRRDFACAVATNGFMDYDGFGCPAKNMDGVLRMANIHIYPSRANELPADADFVVWFNR